MAEEYTGGSVSYYAVDINRPLDEKADPYKAECQDIIDALGMDFNEGCAFKAIWRRAAARNLGLRKKGYDEGLYDAQKVEFYGARMVAKSTPAVEQNNQADTPPGLPPGWLDIRTPRPPFGIGDKLDLLMVNNTVRTVSYEPSMLFPDVVAWRFSQEGWVEHDGKGCPPELAGRKVYWRRNNGVETGPHLVERRWVSRVCDWNWVQPSDLHIVAYRLA